MEGAESLCFTAVHATNFAFDGFRCDLVRAISMAPAFQITHGIAMGSQGGPMSAGVSPGNYTLAAMYASQKALMYGTVGLDGGLSGRMNYSWSPKHTTKSNFQLTNNPQLQNVVQLEHSILGRDYALDFKTFNISPIDFSGMYQASYLQSVTKNLALGSELMLQRSAPGTEDAAMSYLAKYTGSNKDWIATANLSGQGAFLASYWQRLAEKVEGGVDLVLIPDARPRERRAKATLGAKWDFRLSSMKAQIDSEGKVTATLDTRIGQAITFLLCGEIDYPKAISKWGVGLQIESSVLTEEEMLAQQSRAAETAPPL